MATYYVLHVILVLNNLGIFYLGVMPMSVDRGLPDYTQVSVYAGSTVMIVLGA